jgi:CBS domain-containing protein
MSDSIARAAMIEIEPLHADTTVWAAAQRLVDVGLPALPATEADGRYVGIFGEREFMTALFPGYVGTLASARLVSPSIDASIDRRASCRDEPIRRYLTTDHVVVEDEFSDTQLAELFLHYRVLIIPIATKGHVHAIVTRSDFFRHLVERFGAIAADDPEDSGREGETGE